MTTFLVWLAVVLQSADAGVTCHRLSQGGFERNPMLPKTCGRIILMKSVLTAPVFVLQNDKHRRIWAGAMAASGGVGLTLTFTY